MTAPVAPAFARFAAGLHWAGLPTAVRDAVRDHVLDTLAVACAGASEPESAMLRECHCRASGGGGVCTIVAGHAGQRLPPMDAALQNAFAARIHTFDDTLEAGPIHPGSAVVMAALAAASFRDAPLSEALLGAVAGYELAVRLAEALGPAHYDAGFHGTGTLNAPAAALAAARALGLGAEATAHAISLGAAAASGTRQHQVDGSMANSALNGARAAAAGVQAALHAEAGMTGAATQLDGRWGLMALLGGAGRAVALPVAALGEDWALLRVALKPYATCRFTHGPVALLAAMRASESFAAHDVEALEIRTFAQSASVSDRPSWQGRAEAILSHQFAAAATLLGGPPRLRELDALAEDAAVQRLAARVSIVVDPAFERRGAAEWPHRLRLTLRDGRVLEAFSPTPPGGADAPLGQAMLHAKARELVDGALGEGRFDALPPLLATPERSATRDLLALIETRP